MKSYNSFPKIASAIIISMVLLAGCSETATLPPATATSIPPSETPLAVPIELTSTPLPTSTLKPTPSITVEECIPVEENLPSDLVLSGVWLRNEATPYFENLDDHADYIVPFMGGGLLGEMAISPDGKYLAYIDKYYEPESRRIEKRVLRVIKSSGHSLQMDYWVEDWQWIIGWVNDQELALFNAKKEVIILNPFSGIWKRFQKPDWVTYSDNYWDLPPSFSPTLEWILIEQNYNDFVLRNVQTGEAVWKAVIQGTSTWSADGSTLAIVTLGYINIINKEGKIEKFSTKLEGDSIHKAKISPNGNKIAFIVSSYSPKYKNEFFLFDSDQLKIVRLCPDGLTPWNPPVWSPDNRFVIQVIQKSYNEQFDVLIDTQEMRAYKLISGNYNHRIAWLAKP